MTDATFRARFRFRVQKKLNVSAPEHRLSVAGREIVLSTPTPDTEISKSEWLIMNVRGFASDDEAKSFAAQLKAAAGVSSISTRLGIDAGVNLPTSGLGRSVRDRLRDDHGMLVRDNVHGVDVFEDAPNVRIFSLSATGTVLANAKPFLDNLETFLHAPEAISADARDVVLLLNYALMRPEPVAQIVFSISAVEMLGQQQEWSQSQKQLLDDLVASARSSMRGSEAERQEVVDAIGRGLHKVSLRQGVLRLLDALGLSSLKKSWDSVYAERSTLVHGLAPRPGADYSQLAFRTVSLCGRILLKFVAREITSADRHVDEFYAVT